MSDTDKFNLWYERSALSGLISTYDGPFANEFCAYADFNAGQFYFKWADLNKILAELAEFDYAEKLLQLNVKITELGKKTGWVYLYRRPFPDGQSIKLKDVDPERMLHKELSALIKQMSAFMDTPKCDLPECTQLHNKGATLRLHVAAYDLFFCSEEHKNTAMKRWGKY